jgi:hypothetical protein
MMTRTPCLDDSEWADWVAINTRIIAANRADLPCRDCTVAFAAEMRASGQCTGIPGGRGRFSLEAPSYDRNRRRAQWRAYRRRKRAVA